MAKIGDFAIAKFDGDEFSKNGKPLSFEELPCLIIGRDSFPPHWQEFVYWKKDKNGKLVINSSSLPKNRLKTIKTPVCSDGLNLTYIDGVIQ